MVKLNMTNKNKNGCSNLKSGDGVNIKKKERI